MTKAITVDNVMTHLEAFQAIAGKLKGADPKRVGAVVGDLAGVEETFALKALMAAIGTPNLDCRQAGERIDPAWGRAAYTLGAGIAGMLGGAVFGFGWMIFHLLVIPLQAFIFMMLTIVYLSMAHEDNH